MTRITRATRAVTDVVVNSEPAVGETSATSIVTPKPRPRASKSPANPAKQNSARKQPNKSAASSSATPRKIVSQAGAAAARKPRPNAVKTVLSTIARREHSPSIPDDPPATASPVRISSEIIRSSGTGSPAVIVPAPESHLLSLSERQQFEELRRVVREQNSTIGQLQEEKKREQVRVERIRVRRLRRAEKTDLWTDAPMREVLGLGVLYLDKKLDGPLIQGRNDLYKWVLATTQKVLWDGHTAIDDEVNKRNVGYGAAWSKIGKTRRDYLVRCYRRRVLEQPRLRGIFFYPDDDAVIGETAVSAESGRAPQSIFEDDWPMMKMLRDALKNEKDGDTDTKEWQKLIHGSVSQLAPNGRPLIGNSVLRIWRDSRLPYALAKTHSASWDISPTQAMAVVTGNTSESTHISQRDSFDNVMPNSEVRVDGSAEDSMSEDDENDDEQALHRFSDSDGD